MKWLSGLQAAAEQEQHIPLVWKCWFAEEPYFLALLSSDIVWCLRHIFNSITVVKCLIF